MTNRKGMLIVLSGPSGCGKGTVCRMLAERNENITLSVSATTRECRSGEQDGVNYFFISEEDFFQRIRDDRFLEYFCGYNGHNYGTPKDYVFARLDEGKDVILEIENNGAKQVKQNFPEGVFIFLLPPDLNTLYRRLVDRGRDSEQIIKERFAQAEEEIRCADGYDYVIVNDDLLTAVGEIEEILRAEHHKTKRNQTLIQSLIK